MADTDYTPPPTDGREAYDALPSYAALRTREVSGSFAPVIALTDAYGILISRVVCMLADVPTRDQQERAVRDLLADTFDFLLAWRRAVLEGQLVVGYPLARRAFESLSLLVTCGQDPRIAREWCEGKQIKNSTIRKTLASVPMPAHKDVLKELYSFFSSGAHPNRGLIPMRLLGEGNAFGLGSVGRPNAFLVTDHLLKLVRVWSWFGAYVDYHYRQVLEAKERDWPRDYLVLASWAKTVSAQLADLHDQLREQVKRAGVKWPELPHSFGADK